MVKKTEIIANVTASFNNQSDVNLNTAQGNLRNCLVTFEKATRNAVSKLQVCSIALVKVAHAGAGEKGLQVVPDKKTLKELLKVQIDAVCTDADGKKDEVKARNISASAERICEQAMLILKGDFIIGWSPKGDNVFFEGQKKADFKPNPKLHEERVFRPSNVPFPKFKDNGNIRTNSPEDIVPVTVTDTQNTYGKEFLQKPLNNEQTGFEVVERGGKVQTVANAKEGLRAILGLQSYFKENIYKDGDAEVGADAFDPDELDKLVTSDLFEEMKVFAQQVNTAWTVIQAVQKEEEIKIKDQIAKAKLQAEKDAKIIAEDQAEKDAKKLDKKNNPKNYLPKVYAYGDHTKGQIKAKTKEIAKEIAEIDAKSAQKNKAKSA